jgi:TatD DNase family protein
MNQPLPEDYIDIHTHDSLEAAGIFAVENLMAHQGLLPADLPDRVVTFGIHPWNLTEDNADEQVDLVRKASVCQNLLAIGEAGFDRLRGPAAELQARIFRVQAEISESIRKPLYIHCVRAWDELLPVHKRLKPEMPWLIHGFRGNPELAAQLVSKGMYLSFWFAFVMRPESASLLRSVPTDRIFLETDGSETAISEIYIKVAADLNMTAAALRSQIHSNFETFFNSKG